MRFAMALFANSLALAEHNGICQSRPTTSLVNGPTTGKVERGEVEQPAIGVPGPASNRAVYDGSPEEAEDKGWQDTTTLERSTDNDLDGTGAEEELVQAEDDLGKIGRAGRRSNPDIAHTKIGHVTNEGTSSARVSESVAPEHPLEGGHGNNSQ